MVLMCHITSTLKLKPISENVGLVNDKTLNYKSRHNYYRVSYLLHSLLAAKQQEHWQR